MENQNRHRRTLSFPFRSWPRLFRNGGGCQCCKDGGLSAAEPLGFQSSEPVFRVRMDLQLYYCPIFLPNFGSVFLTCQKLKPTKNNLSAHHLQIHLYLTVARTWPIWPATCCSPPGQSMAGCFTPPPRSVWRVSAAAGKNRLTNWGSCGRHLESDDLLDRTTFCREATLRYLDLDHLWPAYRLEGSSE